MDQNAMSSQKKSEDKKAYVGKEMANHSRI